MNTKIYYFSGTGNSLRMAKDLATKLEGAEIRNIAEELPGMKEATMEEGQRNGREDQGEGGQRIGFVFPTYAYGLPRMVKEFAEAFIPPKGSYLFAVTTCAGIPGKVLKQFNKILKKKKHRLHAGWAVLDPSSSLINDPEKDGIQRIMISANKGEKPKTSSERIDEIAEVVGAGKDHPLETSNGKTNFIGSLLYPLAMKSFPDRAADFWVDEGCTGCGICAQICPRGNITLVDGKPQWGNDCEMCHACIQWCPNTAVQYKDLTGDRARYRNPEVKVKEMVLRECVKGSV